MDLPEGKSSEEKGNGDDNEGLVGFFYLLSNFDLKEFSKNFIIKHAPLHILVHVDDHQNVGLNHRQNFCHRYFEKLW